MCVCVPSQVVHTHLVGYELVSGCVSGEIKFWDIRMPHASVRTIEVGERVLGRVGMTTCVA